jgi:hypothetical protein
MRGATVQSSTQLVSFFTARFVTKLHLTSMRDTASSCTNISRKQSKKIDRNRTASTWNTRHIFSLCVERFDCVNRRKLVDHHRHANGTADCMFSASNPDSMNWVLACVAKGSVREATTTFAGGADDVRSWA